MATTDDQSADKNLEGMFEDPLFRAMNAYRAAKHANDKEAMHAAEEAWREQVRANLIASMNS